MPNWATGTLKIRGTRENILKFCKEKMAERANSYRMEGKPDQAKRVEWDMCPKDWEYDHGELIATTYEFPDLCIWLKDSRRNFVDMDTDVPYDWDMGREGDRYETRLRFYEIIDSNGNSDYMVVFPFMAAWGVEEEYFVQLSKEYDLIFKVYTVEQGMGFFEEFEAAGGKFKDLGGGPSKGPEREKLGGSYGRFVWECPIPFIGG